MKKNKNLLENANARYVGSLSLKDSPSYPCKGSRSGWREGTTILKTNVKNNSKLRPFNKIMGDVGKMQYFPAWSKEWRNSVYHYNSNLIKNFPVYDLNIYKIIKSYFNMFFNHQFLKYDYIRPKRRRLSFNKIFLARPEIKHTNSKAIITLYAFNREKFALLKKIKILTKLTKKIIKFVQRKNSLLKIENIFFKFNMIFAILKNRNLLQDFYAYYSTLKTSKIKAKEQANKWIKLIFKKELTLIRKYKFRLNLNKYKFEDKLLYGLSNIIRKLYNKEIEFNIVNLKNIVFNTDLFTEISTLKIKKRNAKVVRIMNIMLNKANLPYLNRIQETGRLDNNVSLKLVENRYKTLNIRNILGTNSSRLNLDKLLNKIYISFNDKLLPQRALARSKNILKGSIYQPGSLRGSEGLSGFGGFAEGSGLYDMVFNSIKYKNMAGIRMEVKGRLTKRYRADRSVYKLRWKGGLKNIDSSFKGLSVRKNRGHINPNVGYSIFSSKRRVGAFAVKGWMAGKSYSTIAVK
uniref:hypothetical protein n=1 Tax=Diaporthe sojae TaxID=165439 RepID=UPI0024102778|nr:hypothetical protein QAZ32_mgp44 [Diaporthe sojae]WET30395.1 hypothetical protein [Diaporthe sojae]